MPEKKEPFFSIIVPCFNSAETLPRLLGSLKSQFYQDFEVILVDDCSTEPWRTQCPSRGRTLCTPKNGGPGVARQFGLDNAKGSYIIFIDSDDMLASPLTLGQIVGALQNFNFPDILSTTFYEVHPASVTKRDAQAIGWVHGKIYKREYLQKNDIRFPDWRRTEDGAFNYVAFSLTSSVVYVNELDTYLWMFREDSIVHSEDYTLNMIPEYARGYERAYKILKEKNVPGLPRFAVNGAVYIYLYDQATKSRKTDKRKVNSNEKFVAKVLKEMEIPKYINACIDLRSWMEVVALPIQQQMTSMRNQEPGLILSESFPAWVARLTRKKVRRSWEEKA